MVGIMLILLNPGACSSLQPSDPSGLQVTSPQEPPEQQQIPSRRAEARPTAAPSTPVTPIPTAPNSKDSDEEANAESVISSIVEKPEVIAIPIVVSPSHSNEIAEDSRIVIMNVSGDCSTEVKDALMRRLIDNPKYNVLSRDYLSQIVVETEQNWSGQFNTDTASKLGELMGASLFIVGQVAYCGVSDSDSPDNESGVEFIIMANIQIIDVERGKVLVSTASEGRYIPRPKPELYDNDPLEAMGQESLQVTATNPSTEAADRSASNATTRLVSEAAQQVRSWQEAADPDSERYPWIKAADDMANSFADKFFARPTWERVEMFSSPKWLYNDSVQFVRLGHCQQATRFMDEVASHELDRMPESDVGRYLHNYGVALLCSNHPAEAIDKLRSAYRIGLNQTTLKMLGLASRITEWSLTVALDSEPEVEQLLKRGPQFIAIHTDGTVATGPSDSP